MIYVTTGTHNTPFDRLIIAMDEYAASSAEPVIIQAGPSQVPIRHAQHFAFTSWEESRQHIQSARVVVAQAGIGTLMDAIGANVPIIVWPRMSRYGEAGNDHQAEIATILSQQGRVTMVNSAEELHHALRQAALPLPRQQHTPSGGLIPVLKDRLNAVRGKPRR
jgi:UDP-N-acetylglucosamine transferase subunit ALG13